MERRYIVIDNDTVVMVPNAEMEAEKAVADAKPIVSASVAEGLDMAPRYVEEMEM